MGKSSIILATIGYEAAELADFVATLRAASIDCLIDIRELAISRRKGFAKRALSAALSTAGIRYVHLRGLGDPKAGRDAAKAGDFTTFRAIFSTHLKSDTAQADLQTAVSIAKGGGACLMCYERDHDACHRSIVAKEISVAVPVVIYPLLVKEGFGKMRSIAGTYELIEERP